MKNCNDTVSKHINGHLEWLQCLPVNTTLMITCDQTVRYWR